MSVEFPVWDWEMYVEEIKENLDEGYPDVSYDLCGQVYPQDDNQLWPCIRFPLEAGCEVGGLLV